MTDKKNDRIDLVLGTNIMSGNESFEINPKFDEASVRVGSGAVVLTGAYPAILGENINNAFTAMDAAIAAIGAIGTTRTKRETSLNRSFILSEENCIDHIISQKNSTYSHRFPEGSTLLDDKSHAFTILIELKNGIYLDGKGKLYPYKDFLSSLYNASKK
ncbi:hypothetical protein J2X66_002705 [Pseudomonas sp. 3296]|uniref:hypothetical protein n=1 Tax=Pseudomonas sp. 3296 TaxID=2817753 RepID=UPI00285E7B19|nr:hypothetical protein [Pseudomonas sp. 3296]MDR6915837.1 hypothetical protein [Pseudomonas sp. 3296]